MSIIRDALIKLTGFDKIIRDELSTQNQASGLLGSVTDGMTSEMQMIEQSLSEFSMITRVSRDRMTRYRDFDAMDDYGDVSVALDIYAEEATQNDLIKQQNLWVSGEQKVAGEVTDLFRRLRMRDLIWGLARSLGKHGDVFSKLILGQNGVEGILFIPPRIVTRFGPDINKIKMFRLNDEMKKISPRNDGIFLPWEMTHFRLLSFGYSHFYGASFLDPARKRWLHLKLLEDSVSIYRLNRAVERIVYYIDVGAQSPTEALRTVQRYKQTFGQQRKYLDPNNSQFEMQYDPHHMNQNIFWPVTPGNERSRIEKLAPPPDQGRLQDLEHFSNKLYVALGIPRDYITGETSGSWNSREALSLQDVRFSRKIHRLQVGLLDGLERIARIHLAITSGDASFAANANFRIHLADISIIARQQYENVLIQRVQLIQELNSLAQSLQLNREIWLHKILPDYFPDIAPEFWHKVIISDKELVKAEQSAMHDQMRMSAPAASKPKAKPKISKKTEAVITEVMNDVRAKYKKTIADIEKENPMPVVTEEELAEAIKAFKKQGLI